MRSDQTGEVSLLGQDLFGDPVRPAHESISHQRYTYPPFSVLDSRTGAWQERKRAWLSLGIRGELGRGGELLFGAGLEDGGPLTSPLTSAFDPALCELMYKWFSREGSQVVDPFSGGSVRGIVAQCLGRKYWGCDLRGEQVAENRKQQAEIFGGDGGAEWICGDSMDELDHAPCADFLFSCPPYGDLEKYSNNPGDLSAMDHHAFIFAYKRIVLKALRALKDDRFACFVVADFRGRDGFYRNFVSKTIEAFEESGARLYNEAILATREGSAPMRIGRQFVGRKMVKTHQNVLIFCKGDWRKAAEHCNGGPLDDD